MFSLVPVTDQDRCRQESQQTTIKINAPQTKFSSFFGFSNVNQTKNIEEPKEVKKSTWENLFGPPKQAQNKIEQNQKDKTPSLFTNFFSTNLKKEQNKNEKKQFINEKPQNWPNWTTTKPTQQAKSPQNEVTPKPNEVMRDSLKVPQAQSICRSHCIYFEYYHGDDGYTYFYMKNSTEFVGYKQIFEKYQDNSKCYRNTSIIRVNQEQAKRVLDEKKRNGTYEVIRSWGYMKPIPQ